VITHQDASDLLASFVLDAVDVDEHQWIEDHLADCPRCRADEDAFRDVTAAMGNSVEVLPEGLWAAISLRLSDREVGNQPPMPQLVRREGSETHSSNVRAIVAAPKSRRIAIMGSIVGAAAAATVVLGISVMRPGHQPDRLQAAPASSLSVVVTALETPGHKVVNLKNANDLRQAQFVLASGRGYLVSSNLPTLKSDETYQLWGLVSGQPISLGLLGQAPSQSTFTLAGNSSLAQLRVTVEPSGGSVVPSGVVAAQGSV
jgi:anti-sigma-K factor RskA